MARLPAPLLAFNGQLSLINKPTNPNVLGPAKDWGRNDIIIFLDKVIANPATFGVQEFDWNELQPIRDEIDRLSVPVGEDYIGDGIINPKQHIYRSLNRWDAASKFSVKRHVHSAISYWGPNDLLGLFLSKMGFAPPGARMDNFFLPMTYVYARWCSQLSSTIGGGTGDPPAMVQCTWMAVPGQRPYFLLGSTLCGYRWDVQGTGTWEATLKRARYDLLNTTKLEPRYNFNNSPNLEWYGPGATRFGNCAETYAFATWLRGKTLAPNLRGLALYRPAFQEPYSYKLQQYLFDPCRNCKYVISQHGGTIGKFKWYNERQRGLM